MAGLTRHLSCQTGASLPTVTALRSCNTRYPPIGALVGVLTVAFSCVPNGAICTPNKLAVLGWGGGQPRSFGAPLLPGHALLTARAGRVPGKLRNGEPVSDRDRGVAGGTGPPLPAPCRCSVGMRCLTHDEPGCSRVDLRVVRSLWP